MRWRAFIPTLAVLAGAVIFNLFFLDYWVERGIESAGSRAVGARVELDGVRVKLAGLAILLEGLRVADPDAPMRNALDIETIEFDLAAKPLFWRKFIIEKAEIRGIRTGTPRRKSGALPGKGAPGAKAGAKASRPTASSASPQAGAAGQSLSFSLDALRERYDPNRLKAEDLASYRKAREERERLKEAARSWDKRVEEIEVAGTSEAAERFLQKVKEADYKGAAGAKRAVADLEEAKRLLADVERLRRQVGEAKGALSEEISRTRAAVKEVNRLRAEDYAAAVGELKAGGFSAEGIARLVIGPEWPDKFAKAVFWIRRIRAYLPAGGEGAGKPARPPRAGRDIPFPLKRSWPLFHLREAKVSGVAGKDSPYAYRGELRDVTSHPKMVGRPMKLEIAGSEGEKRLELSAELDYTGKRGREKAVFRQSGLDLKGLKLGNLGGPVEMREGKAAVNASLEVNGSRIKGGARLIADPARLSHDMAEREKTRLLEIVSGTLVGLNRLEVTMALSGELDRPSVSLGSNLDGLLKGAVDQVLNAELKKLQDRYRARIDSLGGPEEEKLRGEVESRAAAVTGLLGAKETAADSLKARLERAAEELKNAGAESAVRDLKKLF